MRKVFLTAISSISILLSSALSISPASAWVLPDSWSVVSFTVGDSVSRDMGCQENNITDVHFDSGTLPPGLTMDSQGIITGSPTTPGDYTLNGYHCTYSGGSYGGYVPSYSVTFRINAITTPTPTLIAHSLNISTCSFYLGYIFPATPDAGSITLKIHNQSGTELVESLDAASFTSKQLYDGVRDIAGLNEMPLDPNFNGTFTGNPFACGDTLTFTIGYQYTGAPVASAVVSNVNVNKPADVPNPTYGGAPIQRLINLNNGSCQFRVLAWLPSAPLAGSTHITINRYHQDQSVDQLTFTIEDQVASGLMDFTFTPEELSSGIISKSSIASEDYQVSTSWECGKSLNVSVDYRDQQNNYLSSTWAPQLQTDGFSVTPTRPEPTNNYNVDYSITAAQSNVGGCNISVVATLPDEARPITLAISSVESIDWIAGVVVNDQVSVNGVITANLSLTSKDAIFANVPVSDENKIFAGEAPCSGTYRVFIDSPVGVLASTTVTLGQVMPTCNSGSILFEEEHSCVEVERGYYTTELNSSTPIACPAGMTTATKASKSINDCYKPIVQSIVGFKSPKALKFSGTTNLAVITNTKAVSSFTVTGPCTAKLVNVVTKVKGKKVTTKMLKVTAGKKAGICNIGISAPSTGKYLDLKQPVQIKVSKTGK